MVVAITVCEAKNTVVSGADRASLLQDDVSAAPLGVLCNNQTLECIMNRPDYKLGDVFTEFESEGRWDVIWKDPVAGFSYGRFQLTQENMADCWADVCSELGLCNTPKVGTSAFNGLWKNDYSQRPEVQDAVTEWVVEKLYRPIFDFCEREMGVVLADRQIVKEVAASMANAYGPDWAARKLRVLFPEGLAGVSDKDFVSTVYNHRKANAPRDYKSQPVKIQQSLAKRYATELVALEEYFSI